MSYRKRAGNMNINTVAPSKISFFSRSTRPNNAIGLDYSCVDEFSKSNYSKFDITLALKDGYLTQDMIEQMILQRLPRTIEKAELFALEHPQLSKEDLIQDLVLHMVSLANKYTGQLDCDFNRHAYVEEKSFLERYLKESEIDIELINSNMAINLNEASAIDNLFEQTSKDNINKFLETKLKPHEKNAIDKFYGLSEQEAITQSEIAKQAGLTRARVQHIINAALFKLSKPHNMKALQNELYSLENASLEDKFDYILENIG